MARAAVKAKQAQARQAQAAAGPSRKQRKHASGGNPNQDLFFMRLRRRQKWVFLGLAIVFAVSFSALGVGSGSGAGLDQLYNGIFGGSDPVGKAKSEIKSNPAKGYKDLANAYVTKNDLTDAIIAMTSYLHIKKTDSRGWALLGQYLKQQADSSAQEYQQVLQTQQIQSPSSIFVPSGSAATQLGTNQIDQYYSQHNQALSGPLYQKAIARYNGSLSAYQKAAKYAPRSTRAQAQLAVYTAAQLVGNTKAELAALQSYVDLAPHSSNVKQIEGICKKLGGSCTPKPKRKTKQ